MDETNPEDIDTDQEDHIYDEACHFVMARPIALKEPNPIKSLADIRIDFIEQTHVDEYEDYALRDRHVDQIFWDRMQEENQLAPLRDGTCFSDIDGR
jgi:hypothetical protein